MPVYDVQVITEDEKFRVIVEADSIEKATDEAAKAVEMKAGPDVETAVKKAMQVKPLIVIKDGMKPQYLGFE